MRNVEIETLALKLAEALLMYRGEISIKDIEAIPFLTNPEDAELIAKYLRSKFKTEVSMVRNKDKEKEPSGWEELITLVQ